MSGTAPNRPVAAKPMKLTAAPDIAIESVLLFLEGYSFNGAFANMLEHRSEKIVARECSLVLLEWRFNEAQKLSAFERGGIFFIATLYKSSLALATFFIKVSFRFRNTLLESRG